MVSICDDLRRLDEMLLLLSQEAARNLQTSLLLHSARRRVQALEKKVRSLDAAHWLVASSPNSSGGPAPLSMWTGTAPRHGSYSSSSIGKGKRGKNQTLPRAPLFSSEHVAPPMFSALAMAKERRTCHAQ